MKKACRILTLACLLAVLLCTLAFHASAATVVASGYCGGEGNGTNLTWELTADGTLTISGTGAMKNYESNSSVPWYSDCSSIKEVIIGDSVRTIGDYAFYNCQYLNEVILGNSVTSIGDYAFYDCNRLTEVTIGNSVTTIGDWAFFNCTSLTEVTIPGSVTTIGARAFDWCDRLTGVYFEGNAPTVAGTGTGEPTFDSDIVTLYYIPGTSGWTKSSASNVTWYGYKLATWNGPVLTSGYCGGEGDGTNLTWELTDDGVLTISGSGAMKNYESNSSMPWYSDCSSIKEVIIGDSVTTIGNDAFRGCDSLTSLTIGDSVTTIGDYAFYYCDSLTSVTIGDSVATIGDSAFLFCKSLTAVTIPDSVTTIGARAFGWCYSLTSVTIGNGVTIIGNQAFQCCNSLASVTIGDSVTTIGDDAFSGCTILSAVTIPDSVTTIGSSAFSSCCYLTAVTIPGSVTTIGGDAFAYCDVLSAVYFEGNAPDVEMTLTFELGFVTLYYIPGTTGWTDSFAYDAVAGTWLGYKLAVWEERATYTVTFNSNGGSAVESQAVSYGGLANEPTAPSCDDYIFAGWYSDEALTLKYSFERIVTSDLTLYAKWEENNILASGYCGGEGDGTNLTWILTKDGVLTISGTGAMVDYTDYSKGPWCYSNRNSVKQVIIGDGVTAIGSYAFPGCVNLTSVTISDSVETIGDRAFDGCSWLSIVVLGNGVTSVGQRAFAECDKLISVVLPDSVTTIKGWAFYDCDNLTEILVNEGNTSFCDIDGVLFNKSKTILISYPAGKSATSYVIPEGVLDISDNAFYECLNLRDVTIPDSVTTVGGNAFQYSALTNVTIGNGVVTIGNSAFANCSGLVSVTIPDSVTTIESYAFQYCLSLASIAIPKNVTTIGDFAFNRCSALTTVTIGSNVTAIKSRAFGYCDNLTSVYFEGNAPSVYKLSGTGSPSFESIVTLYYTPGTTGWTDSSAYDAEAGTWNGYKLEVWRSIVPGDINSDGETNLKDLTRLFQYLADWDVEVNEAVLDVNGDSSVNLKDQTRLFQYLADWDVEIFPAS